jgi:hypothetical protein
MWVFKQLFTYFKARCFSSFARHLFLQVYKKLSFSASTLFHLFSPLCLKHDTALALLTCIQDKNAAYAKKICLLFFTFVLIQFEWENSSFKPNQA